MEGLLLYTKFFPSSYSDLIENVSLDLQPVLSHSFLTIKKEELKRNYPSHFKTLSGLLIHHPGQ